MDLPIFDLKHLQDDDFEKKIIRTQKMLESFFEIKVATPLIFLVKQSDLAIIYQKKQNAHTFGKSSFNYIFIVKNLLKTHPENFWKIFVHEYTHIAMRNFCKTNSILPLWLREGLPSFLAKQKLPFDLKDKEKYLEYYHDKQDIEIYAFGYNMVNEIIKKHGKSKILDILRDTKKLSTYKNFRRYYKDIF